MPSLSVHPLPLKRSLSARLEAIQASTTPTFLQRLVSVLTGFGRLHQRYSVAKLHEFEQYRRTVGARRMLGIVLCTPVLGFLSALLPVWIPLQDPHLGLVKNPGALAHFVVICTIAAVGSVLIPRAGIRLPADQFSLGKVAVIVAIIVLPGTAMYVALVLLWRFPVPFTFVISFGPFCFLMALGHFVVLQEHLTASSTARRSLMTALAWIVIQASQIVIYPAFSALFEVVDERGQVFLALVFPILKYYFKKVSRILGTSFHDFNEEMAVTGVEISASLYQSMIMQSTPSVLTTATVIGVDVVHGIMAVKMFMDRPSVTPHHGIVDLALEYLAENEVEDEKLRLYTPELVRRLTREHRSKSGINLTSISPKEAGELVRLSDDRQRGDLAVIQALEILQAAENILFVEYFEVAIPILNAVYLAIASQPDSARYNPKLAPFHASNNRLVDGLRGILVYSLLQSVTLLAMMAVMRYRYRLSTIRLLSFILERHWWSLQGKMIGWLPLFLHFSLIHFGVDFKFKFDFPIPGEGNTSI